MGKIDELIRETAEGLQGIYENRIAGDSTFIGVLAEMLWKLREDADMVQEFVAARVAKKES